MTTPRGERLDHRTHYPMDAGQLREQAIEDLWDAQTTDNKKLDLILFGEREGHESDLAQSKWRNLQDNLSRGKIDDVSLAQFALDAAQNAKEVSKEILNNDRTKEYLYRDDLLVDKADSLNNTLTVHTIQTIAEKSEWYPFPGEPDGHFKEHLELIQMARKGLWDQIPKRIHEMHLETAEQQAESKTDTP